MAPKAKSNAAVKQIRSHSKSLQQDLKTVVASKSKVQKTKANKAKKSTLASSFGNAVPKKGKLIVSTTPGPLINSAPTTRVNVLVCGDGSAGELGLGTKNAIDVTRPRLNKNLDADTVGVVSLAAGGMHGAALTHDNKIFTWGVNDHHALGRETEWDGGLRDLDAPDDASEASDDSESDLNPKEATPTAIAADKFATGTKIVQITAGNSTTFALTEDGLVYGWGTFRVSSTSVIRNTSESNLLSRTTMVFLGSRSPKIRKLSRSRKSLYSFLVSKISP
jgi:regulator of chromosome condensation